MPLIQTVPVAIASGQSLSGEVDIFPNTLVGIFLPAGWTGTTITFQASVDGGATFGNVESGNAAAELSYTVAAGQYVAIDPAMWRGVTALKLRSGSSAAPTNQAGNATATLVTRALA